MGLRGTRAESQDSVTKYGTVDSESTGHLTLDVVIGAGTTRTADNIEEAGAGKSGAAVMLASMRPTVQA